MIEPALKWFAALAQQAVAPIQIQTDDPRLALYLRDGELVTVEKPFAPRSHEPRTINDLLALAARFDSNDDDEDETKVVVWYGVDQVVLVLDDHADRVEKATVDLQFSDVFLRVRQIARDKMKFDQKAFIRLLRIELAGTLDPVVLLEKVRRLRFENGVRTESTIQRSQESLGRSITSKVESDGDIPEEVALLVPVWKSPGPTDRFPLRCSVEVDPAEGTFRLLPLPDELERVEDCAVDLIWSLLKVGLPSTVPAYHGTP